MPLASSLQTMLNLFVYGSLRRGQVNHRLLEKMGADFQRETRIPHYDMWSLGGAFPGVKENPKNELGIVGEIYTIKPDDLRGLDFFEGYYEDAVDRSMYIRKEVDVGEGQKALMYVFNQKTDHEGIHRVPTGDWAHEK